MKPVKLLILIIMLNGCVSVDLGPKKPTPALGIKAEPPHSPFVKVTAENVDAIWRNPKNGNAISYLSDCNDASDPSLSAIEQGVLSGLYPYTYWSQKEITYQWRGARRVQVKGQVDGVATLVDLLVFKRNNCIYVISYSGIEPAHTEDFSQFETFLQRFRAP
jgi:hypothetical protein